MTGTTAELTAPIAPLCRNCDNPARRHMVTPDRFIFEAFCSIECAREDAALTPTNPDTCPVHGIACPMWAAIIADTEED